MLSKLRGIRKLLGPRESWAEHILLRCQSTQAAQFAPSIDPLDNAKPFEEIPGPQGFLSMGSFTNYLPIIGKHSMRKWHEAQTEKFRKYGKIVKEKMAPGLRPIVHLFDANDIETVYRQEGRQPTREFFTAMKDIRKKQLDVYHTVGLAPSNGEEWYQVRSRTQKVMMRPQIMKLYLPQINIIADDFIKRIKTTRNDSKEVPDLMNELFKWALESVVYVMLQKRMHCLLSDTTDSDAQKLIKAVNDFFTSSGKVELGVQLWKISPLLSPAYRNLRKIHNFLFSMAMDHVQDTLQKLKQKADDDDSDLSLLEMLLKYCTPEVASVMAIDAIAAGIDTTALSTAYLMKNLAENPVAQAKLQAEVDSKLPNGSPVTREALEEMPYLKACIKESMRLSPIVPGSSRTLDHDVVLSGYRVPANTVLTLNSYITSVQEEYFPDAHQYIPERWVKGPSSSAVTGSFAYQPFGFGPRMCIGRRIADLEMLTLITKLMQNFWLENNEHEEIDVIFQLVLMIASPLHYKFNDR